VTLHADAREMREFTELHRGSYSKLNLHPGADSTAQAWFRCCEV